MAERTISPAVFTNEIDSSLLSQGVQQIGGAVVGPFNRGPAYAPTIITSGAELEDLFGTADGEYYQPFTASEYLKQQGVVTIVRVGSLGGYEQKDALIIKATVESVDDEKYEAYHGLESGSCPVEVGDDSVIGVLANALITSPSGESIVDLSGFRGSEVDSLTDLMFYTETEDADGNSVVSSNLRSTIKLRTTDSDGVVQNVGDKEDENGNEIPSDYSFSLDPRDPDSLNNIFGRAAKKNVEPAYFHSYFENEQERLYANTYAGVTYRLSCDVETAIGAGETMQFQNTILNAEGEEEVDLSTFGEGGEFACRPAVTPFIQSQEISGRRYDLFRVYTRNMGTSANREIKIGIYNVRTPGSIAGTDYGTFSLVVRGFLDNDKTQNVIENYDAVTLNPNSPNFIARVIGDRFTTIDSRGKVTEHGDYGNSSRWIRIEMNPDMVAPANAMPYGHGSYMSPVGGLEVPQPIFSHVSQYERNPGRYFNGTIFTEDTPDGILDLPRSQKDTLELFAPIPNDAGEAGLGYYMDRPGSYKEEVDGVVEEYAVSAIDTSPSVAEEIETSKLRRFLVGFQQGFDGHAPGHPIRTGKNISASNVQGLDCSGRFSPGTQGYIRAFQALSNQDEFDINLIVTPGLSLDLHRTVINRGVDLCETREDCFYILDCVSAHNQPGRVDDAVSQASTLDSNYAATYYPWVKIIDPATNRIVPYPPSALMMAVFASNDQRSAEWFAPAGLNRGGIESAVSVMDRLNFAERDTLYEGKVNPIAAFPGQGIVAFGQKTLQRNASALDRINVRRLLINLKKFIASSARFLIFEQNVTATRNRFLGIVNPYLENVQQRLGLYAFRVIMDDSNNTPEMVDRNIMYGQIFIQPARSVEYIVLDFNVQSTGATFGA
jgi:hypothetical protein